MKIPSLVPARCGQTAFRFLNFDVYFVISSNTLAAASRKKRTMESENVFIIPSRAIISRQYEMENKAGNFCPIN